MSSDRPMLVSGHFWPCDSTVHPSRCPECRDLFAETAGSIADYEPTIARLSLTRGGIAQQFTPGQRVYININGAELPFEVLDADGTVRLLPISEDRPAPDLDDWDDWD